MEEDCINKILDFYNKQQHDLKFDVESEKWLHNSKYLMMLMEKLDKNMKNYRAIKNCLILLINLCFDLENADIYQGRGRSTGDLDNSEKAKYKSLLREEHQK